MTVDRDRKMVWHEKTELYLSYNTIDEAIAMLEGIKASYGGSARIEKRQHRYDDGEYLAVDVEEPETDAEMARRIAQEEAHEARMAERDRSEFERLKKKFGQG